MTRKAPLTHAERRVEEALAIAQLAAQRGARLRAGRQVVHDWPWQVPKRPPSLEPEPVVDIVALAKAELTRDEGS